jgi:protein-L-isoaspartate(D-aspartate) O-methyltransferase
MKYLTCDNPAKQEHEGQAAEMPDYATRRTTMVDTQVRPSDVTKFPIIEAFLHVPREDFVPARLREAAYLGEDLPFGAGRVLLEPRTLAKMLEELNLQPTDLLLDVGCLMGYSSAVAARIAEAVVGLDENADLTHEAEALLAAQSRDNVAIVTGPLVEGAAQHGPYDAMMVQGGVEEFPEALAAQLREGGRVACLFMDGPLGTCRLGLRSGDRISWRDAFNATAPVLPGFSRKRAFAL